MTVIYEGARRSIDGTVRGRVRMRNGRLEAIITGCPEIAVADEGYEFTFEFDAIALTGDVPVRFRLSRNPL